MYTQTTYASYYVPNIVVYVLA